MGKAQYIDPNGVRRNGHLILLQLMDTQADGKRLMLAGSDLSTFHLQDGDQFYTAIFAVNPFDDSDVVSEPVYDETRSAAARVAAYLRQQGQMGGVDHEMLHSANDVTLRASDLRLLVQAFGHDDA